MSVPAPAESLDAPVVYAAIPVVRVSEPFASCATPAVYVERPPLSWPAPAESLDAPSV